MATPCRADSALDSVPCSDGILSINFDEFYIAGCFTP